jgi:hypothetical protein
MKLSLITISFLLILSFSSCFDEEPDCVCSLEFRTYLVTVIDTLGNPVDSLEAIITNTRGKEFNFDELSPPPYMQGAYYVMTDGYENDFTIRPEKILFKGTKDGIEVTGEFYFNTDECRCHVYKIAGQDTLIL